LVKIAAQSLDVHQGTKILKFLIHTPFFGQEQITRPNVYMAMARVAA
jgi:hypothetical protein